MQAGRTGGQGMRVAVWGGAAALMLAPAAASRLTDEMAWDSADFVLSGIMLAAACGAWELAVRKTGSWTYAAGTIVAVGAALLLFLVNAAVGLIGNEDDPVNLLFFGVVILALGGAIIVRFGPEGLARAMAVTAAAQAGTGLLAVLIVPDVSGFLLGTAMFVPLWLLSSGLFAKAARDQAPATPRS
ncbi:MAG TPA: hypothetical protein VF535_11075 [Allosphingosinicella sp.]